MTATEDPYGPAARAAEQLVDRLGQHRCAIVLGSGWAAAADTLGHVTAQLRADELEGVPAPTVQGHGGLWRSLDVSGTAELAGAGPVLCVQGRSHLYEGHTVPTVVQGVRAAVLAGCEVVVLTNAAGSLRPEVALGTTVVLADQLNLTGSNPMVGAAPPEGLPSRFVDVTDLYSARLRTELARRRPERPEGVYAGLVGGSFETPAEIRMLGVMGADLVGMSTVLESIAARHLGAEVVGLSLVTNLAAGLQDKVDHLEVLDVGVGSVDRMASTLADVLAVVAATR